MKYESIRVFREKEFSEELRTLFNAEIIEGIMREGKVEGGDPPRRRLVHRGDRVEGPQTGGETARDRRVGPAVVAGSDASVLATSRCSDEAMSTSWAISLHVPTASPTSSMMALAGAVARSKYGLASSRCCFVMSTPRRSIVVAWARMSAGLRSNAGAKRQPSTVRRNPWLRR